MSSYNSTLYLITDSDAKDEHLKSEVMKGIIEKHLKPRLTITGSCPTGSNSHSILVLIFITDKTEMGKLNKIVT